MFVALFVSGLVVSLFLGEKNHPWGKTSRALGRNSVGGELAGLGLELGVTAALNHAKTSVSVSVCQFSWFCRAIKCSFRFVLNFFSDRSSLSCCGSVFHIFVFSFVECSMWCLKLLCFAY